MANGDGGRIQGAKKMHRKQVVKGRGGKTWPGQDGRKCLRSDHSRGCHPKLPASREREPACACMCVRVRGAIPPLLPGALWRMSPLFGLLCGLSSAAGQRWACGATGAWITGRWSETQVSPSQERCPEPVGWFSHETMLLVGMAVSRDAQVQRKVPEKPASEKLPGGRCDARHREHRPQRCGLVGWCRGRDLETPGHSVKPMTA